MTDRNALRSAALKTRKPRSVLVEFEGVTYEIRAPSVRTRGKILEQAGMLDEKKRDTAKLYACAVLHSTFVPGTTDERVFEDGDLSTLLDDPAGGLVDVLAEKALEFLNVSMDKDAAKNG